MEGGEELIYTLNEAADSEVDKDIETMDEWLAIMNDEELAVFHRICNRETLSRSEEDNFKISKFSLVLYCRELGLKELAITDELTYSITSLFIVNVIVESLRRRGLATTDGPLLLYKGAKTTITEKGKEYLKNNTP